MISLLPLTRILIVGSDLEILFGQKLWGLILIISIVLAIGTTLLLYFRISENAELSKLQLRVLMLLRFLTVFCITFLLAAPLLKTLKRITRNPVVLIAIDNSLSMAGITDPGAARMDLKNNVRRIREEISDKFDVLAYTFGNQTMRNDSPMFNEKRSDYSQMLQSLYSGHFNENIGALVIIGDGSYNQGENPQNLINKFSYPVFTLGTGDTSAVRDAFIADIRVNKTAFSGNRFPLEADLKINGCNGQNLLFSISRKGIKEFSQQVAIDKNDFFLTVPVVLDAPEEGLQYYSARIEPVPGEQNKNNNATTFVVNILKNKQKILILSNGPHPDAGALKNALENQVNYEVELYNTGPYPARLTDYNLVILNQIPSSSNSALDIIRQLHNSRIPLLFMIGAQTNIQQFNLLGYGAVITQSGNEYEESQVSLNEQFSSFTLSNSLKEKLEKYPPLKVPFGDYSLDVNYQSLAFQRIKNIATSRPLIATGISNGRKAGLIFGEGLWRWRMYDYVLSSNHNEFNELIDKLVQFLALRNNEDNFYIDYKPYYYETENILMTAEVYNEAYEMITLPEVTLSVTDSTNRQLTYTFDRSNQFYRLDAGLYPPGNYRFDAKTSLGKKEFEESGKFAVLPVNIEQVNMQANHRMLHQLSYETNGQFFQSGNENGLIKAVMESSSINPVNYHQIILNEILNIRWIFFVLLALLSSEWILRKFWGIY